MLTPCPNQQLPSKGSRKLILFDCSCGNKEIIKIWKNFISGHTTSCGKCNLLTEEHFEITKYGKLRMKEPISTLPNSNKKIWWICDCGKETLTRVIDVISGNTSSCGKCNLLTKDHFEKIKYSKLRMKDPIEIYANSNKIRTWVCDCGKETECQVYNVTRGLIKTCGKCNLIPKSYFETIKYGKLKLKNPQDLYPQSEKLTTWLCDCGNEITTKSCYVIQGDTKSCGRCNIINKDELNNKTYGRLQTQYQEEIYPRSNKKIEWDCSCGNTTKALIHNVTRNKTVSCGKCYEKAIDWYENNKIILLNLKTPINPSQIPIGNVIALETIKNTCKPFKAICGICKSEYYPIWGNIRSGGSLSCGCSTNHISYAQKEIANFIEELGFSTTVEYKLDKWKYDICVPSKKLLIEYHGLKWHSGENTKNNIQCILIFED